MKKGNVEPRTGNAGMKISFTIPLPPITKKNSQRIVTVKGRPIIIPSKQYKTYERACFPFLKFDGEPPLCGGPVNVKTVFYMPTRRRVDLVNLQEAVLDILVKYGVLADDNCSVVASMDGSRVTYDKENPRTEIEIGNVAGNETGAQADV